MVTVRQAPLGPATQTLALEVAAAAAAGADKAEQEALAALAGSPEAVAVAVAQATSQVVLAALAALVMPASLLSKETQCATQSLKTVWW